MLRCTFVPFSAAESRGTNAACTPFCFGCARRRATISLGMQLPACASPPPDLTGQLSACMSACIFSQLCAREGCKSPSLAWVSGRPLSPLLNGRRAARSWILVLRRARR
uniref:Uncharacterized protein n=1 Tax=Alexandrium monilatum TaxID=311494 RepID=A0A7S4Q2Z6_9DINO